MIAQTAHITPFPNHYLVKDGSGESVGSAGRVTEQQSLQRAALTEQWNSSAAPTEALQASGVMA